MNMKTPVTALDKALIAAAQDVQQQGAFYNAFLASKLFVPLPIGQPINPTPRRTKKNEQIDLCVIPHNGKNYVPAFDSLERLTAWSKGKTNYIALSAYALMQAIPKGLHLMLNTSTGFAKEFVPDEIAMLRNTVGIAQPKPSIFPAGTKMYVGVAAQIPPALELALDNCLRQNSEILYAYIGQVYFQVSGEVPHLYIALEADRPIENILEALRQHVGIALRPFYNESNPIGVAFLGVDTVAEDIKRVAKPFYHRSATQH